MAYNAAAKDYVYANTSDHCIKHGSALNSNDYLWWFEASGDGVKIGNKACIGSSSSYYGKKGAYLRNERYGTLGLGYFNGTGDTWYLERTPYNQMGLLVKGSDSKYWIRGTGSTGYIDPTSTFDASKKDYYVWIFKSYGDLLQEGRDNGMDVTSYESADSTLPASFKTLIDAIAAYKSSSATPTIADGDYLILNRRHNLYLNPNGTEISCASTPTQYSVWTKSVTGGSMYLVNKEKNISIRINGSSDGFTLNTSDINAFNPTIGKSSDGDSRFLQLKYSSGNTYFSLDSPTGNVSARSTNGISADWQFIPVSDYLAQQEITQLPEVVAGEDEISEDHFYLIANIGRDFDNYKEDTPDARGYLTDVDHVHHSVSLWASFADGSVEAFAANNANSTRNLTYANTNLGEGATPFAVNADAQSAQASSLWQFVCISHGTGSMENATGLLSSEHNVYQIRNANTGKYISKLTGGTFTLTANKSDAGNFFVTRMTDGQLALNSYTGTSAGGTDNSDGVLVILGTSDAQRAGLGKADAGTGAANSSSSWMIIPAQKIRLNLLTDTHEDDNYYWSTFYYPFDVKLTEDFVGKAEIIAGGWLIEQNKVALLDMGTEVPAGNAVIVRSDQQPYVELYAYPDGKGNLTATSDQFAGNVWQGVAESEGHSWTGEEWRQYWILSRSKAGVARLLHPAEDYLVPNRAFIPAANVGNEVRSLNFFFYRNNDEVTSISDLLKHPSTLKGDATYDLQGRRVSGRLGKGIYIRGGRKVYIK